MGKLFSIFLLALVVAGCANTGNKSIANATPESVETLLKIGETTKEEVTAIFGAPITAMYTDGGLLIWTYRYDDTTALTAETVGSFLFTMGLAGGKSEGTRNELVILFDKNDVVKRYNMSNSPIESGSGIF